MRRSAIALFACAAACSANEGTLGEGAQLSVTPPSIDFGVVGTGYTQRVDLLLENDSDAEVAIDGITTAAGFHSDGYLFDLIDRPSSVAAHSSAKLGVTFTPFAVTPPVESRFSIMTAYGAIEVPVHARGVTR